MSADIVVEDKGKGITVFRDNFVPLLKRCQGVVYRHHKDVIYFKEDVLECLKALKNMTVADLGEIKHELIQLKPKWLDFLSSGYPSIYWEIVDAIIYDTYPLIIEQQIKKIFGEEE